MQLQAQAIFLNTLGANAHDSLLSLVSIAKCRSDLGQEEQARALFEQSVIGLTELFGEAHPDTIYAQNKLAISDYKLGRRQSGLKTSIRVLENSLAY